ncbi:MAG: nickel-responsive transcriptional regulator NikR [Gemmataceae bacterium]
MAEVTRFSVSLEPDLLAAFDRFVTDGRFATRSEAVRQLLRQTLTAEAWAADARPVMATLTLVYDHHKSRLTDKLVEVQHRHGDLVVATLHVHLDHDHCMEVIVLRGKGSEVRALAAELRGLKGVHKGELTLADTAPHTDGHHHHH